MATTSIEWTQATWNPTTGCTKVSPGCKYCYAERMSKRLRGMKLEKYSNIFDLTLHETLLNMPLAWKKPKLIFVDSMSDLFHEKVPFDFILKVFSVIKKASWHQFQILTKRSERLLEFNSQIEWPKNAWMGVSIENQDYMYRVDHLRSTDAYIKFLSLEPLLGPLPSLYLANIDWVIVGGESGPKARPIREEWVVEIHNQCLQAKVPFFFKQWGGTKKKTSGRILQGKTWDEMPILASLPTSLQFPLR
jgi:protein gp37